MTGAEKPPAASYPAVIAVVRLLVQTAFALALAILVALGVYAVLLAVNAAPAAAGTTGPIAIPSEPALDVRVPEPPPPVTVAPPRAPRRETPSALSLGRAIGAASIRVRGSGPAADGLGVGVVDGSSRALIAWRPLEGTLPVSVPIEGVPTGKHRAVLATAREVARFAYLARAPLDVAVREGEVRGTAELDATRHDVEIVLEGGEGETTPLVVPILRRADDPGWIPVRPMPPVAGEDGRATLPLTGLGEGVYELALDGVAFAGGEPIHTFTVPGPESITIPCRRP